MCHDLDSRPPIAPIAGGALDSMPLILAAADRNRFAAFRARATEPSGAGVVILPDVRGLHPFYEELALRFAEHGIDALAIDWYGRSAGAEPRPQNARGCSAAFSTSKQTSPVRPISLPSDLRTTPRWPRPSWR